MHTSDHAALGGPRGFAERAGERIQADPHDFLPSLVRLQESPPSPLGRRVLAASLIFLAAVLLWAAFGRLDIIAAPASQGPAKTAGEPLAYRTLVDLKHQFLEADGEKFRLAPGMQVSAEIHLGTRTVLEYLLSPVQKAFHEAARER